MKMKVLSIALVFAPILAGLGYLSNCLSRKCCCRAVALRVLSNIPPDHPYYTSLEATDEDAANAFDEVAPERTRRSQDRLEFLDYPRVQMTSSAYLPFIVGLHHLWEREAEIGGGGTTVCVTFFGHCWVVGEINRFVT